MTISAYSDFVGSAILEPIVLAEVDIKVEPVGWLPVTGLTNSYQVIIDPFIAQDKTPGGILAEVVAVSGDATVLDSVASPWVVDGQQNSFFYNLFGLTEQQEAILGVNLLGLAVLGVGSSNFDTNALIIHVADTNSITVAPTVLDAITVAKRLYFGTKAVVFNNRLYEPRLDDNTEISLKETADDIMFGSSKSVGSGSLKLLNGDGIFDALFNTVIWNNANVTIRFGGPGLTFGQFQTVGLYKVEGQPVFDFNAIELNIRDEQKLTTQSIPKNVFKDTDFPNIDPASTGRPIPILLGKKTNITPIAVGDTTNIHVYMISDPAVGGIFKIDAIRLVDTDGKTTDTINPLSVDVQQSLAGGTFAILFSFSGTQVPSNTNVRVDAKGIPADATQPWVTSTDYLKHYGEQVAWIFTQLLGLKNANFDSAAALVADAEFEYEHGQWIKEVLQAKEYIRIIETGVLGRTIRTLEGKIKPTTFSPVTDFANIQTLRDVDVMEFNPSQEIESGKIFSRVRVLYDTDPTSGAQQDKEAFEDRTRFLYLDGIDETRTLETALVNDVDALDLSQRVRFISRLPTLRVTIPETGISLLDANLVDRILVTVRRGPDATGAWTEKLMEIDTIERTYAPVPGVVVTLNDLLGIGSTAARWVESSHPDFLNSTTAERSRAGFWSDLSGLVDPTSALTREIKLWF